MANVEIPLEKFTFITDKTILDELYAERSIEVLSTEDFLSLPPTEAYLNNPARIERVAREKTEREIAELEALDPSFNPSYLFTPDCLYTVDVSNNIALYTGSTTFSVAYDSDNDSIPLINADTNIDDLIDSINYDGTTDTEEKDDDIIENGASAQYFSDYK